MLPVDPSTTTFEQVALVSEEGIDNGREEGASVRSLRWATLLGGFAPADEIKVVRPLAWIIVAMDYCCRGSLPRRIR
jgi:hypothetical protein